MVHLSFLQLHALGVIEISNSDPQIEFGENNRANPPFFLCIPINYIGFEQRACMLVKQRNGAAKTARTVWLAN
jgi:hypothetical protein